MQMYQVSGSVFPSSQIEVFDPSEVVFFRSPHDTSGKVSVMAKTMLDACWEKAMGPRKRKIASRKK